MIIHYNEKFTHLSELDIQKIYKRYIIGDKVSDIIKDYNINISASQLIRTIPSIESDKFKCPYCKIPMFIKLRSKSYTDKKSFFCKNCNHAFINKDDEKFCYCSHCKKNRIDKIKAEKQELKNNIEKYISNNKPAIKYSNLTLIDKCNLYALSLYRLEYDVNYFLSLSELKSTMPESFTIDKILSVTADLYNHDIFTISSETDRNTFESIDPLEVIDSSLLRFEINIIDENSNKLNFNQLFYLLDNEIKNISLTNEQLNELKPFLLELQIEDGINYLNYKINQFRNYPLVNNSGKINVAISDTLHQFPLSQLRYFIQKAVKDAVVFYESRKASNKQHAINTISGSILSLAEKAIENNWDISSFPRGKGYRSQLNFVFFDLLLGQKKEGLDIGFNKSYSEIMNIIESQI